MNVTYSVGYTGDGNEGCLASNYRGYIYATQNGTYTFTIIYVDDVGFFWTGDKAYTNYTAANADMTSDFTLGRSVSFGATFEAGSYYPFRIMGLNAGGPEGLNFQVTRPDGSQVLNGVTTASEEVVQYGCNGVAAPPFPFPFGAE